MGLKRNSKVSAEFSMSSLTDIIFLLLIFFMLTSNFVQIQPFDLPESDSKTVAPVSVVVAIEKTGVYTVDNVEVPRSSLNRAIATAVRGLDEGPNENTTITIVAETGTDFERVTEIMGIAAALRVKAIIATQPTST